jgi:Zn-dependent protease with chaperone function
MSKPEPSRLSNLFKDLQQRKLIDSHRKLELSRNPVIGMQGNKLSKKILYTEKFDNTVLTELDDDTLRFVLLHEEGHIQKGSLFSHAILSTFVIIFIALFYYPFNFGWPLWFFYLLIGFPLSYRIMYIPMFKEELMADLFAAEAMKKEFHVDQPSVLLQKLFSKADEKLYQNQSKKYSKLVLLGLLILFGFFPGYHPPDCTRISNIVEKCENSFS